MPLGISSGRGHSQAVIGGRLAVRVLAGGTTRTREVSGSGDPLGLLAGYDAAAELYDEAVDDGRPRAASLPALRAVAEQGVAELAERFSEDIARLGMNFRSVD